MRRTSLPPPRARRAAREGLALPRAPRAGGDEAGGAGAAAAIEAAHRDASHCCWAWRLGAPPRERCSDAGEPGGTAGPPILRALQTAELADALLVVVRWFGGTKLGKGGLVRAYGAWRARPWRPPRPCAGCAACG
jgi:hypothetical protein